MIDIDTSCPACGETFANEGARQRHIPACLDGGFDEYDIHLGVSVEEAIDQAETVIEAAVEAFDEIALVWNGDKDSTVLLHLVVDAVGPDAVDVVVIEHGQHFEETEEYIAERAEELGVDFELWANEDFLDKCVTDPPYLEEDGEPITWLPVGMLDELNQAEVRELIDAGVPESEYREEDGEIEVPFYAGGTLGTALLQGMPMEQVCRAYEAVMLPLSKWETPEERRDEKGSAFREAYVSRRESPAHYRVHPMLDFRSEFGWAYLQHPERNIDVHPLYHEGYEEIGPKPVVDPEGEGEEEGVNVQAEPDRGVMEHLRDLGYM